MKIANAQVSSVVGDGVSTPFKDQPPMFKLFYADDDLLEVVQNGFYIRMDGKAPNVDEQLQRTTGLPTSVSMWTKSATNEGSNRYRYEWRGGTRRSIDIARVAFSSSPPQAVKDLYESFGSGDYSSVYPRAWVAAKGLLRKDRKALRLIGRSRTSIQLSVIGDLEPSEWPFQLQQQTVFVLGRVTDLGPLSLELAIATF